MREAFFRSRRSARVVRVNLSLRIGYRIVTGGEKAIFVPHLPEFDEMEPIYTFMLAAMALLAVTGLFIGVMNDARNFLNSAIGSKAAPCG